MTARNKNIPALRFKEFDGKWEVNSGSDIFISSRKKGNDDLPIYSVTLDRGMVPRNSLDRSMLSDAKATDSLFVAKNDIAYNMMRMWQGAYGLSPENCMVSPAYVVLHPKANISSDFFLEYFARSRSLYLFTAYSYGLTSDRLRLYFKDFAQIKFNVPKFPEQQKIASFLSAIDEKIRQLTRKKELLEQYKKGVMQQLFSGKLRFKDENGKGYAKWEQKKLGDVIDYIQPTKYLVESTEYDDSYDTPVLTAGKTFILGYTNETKNIYNESLPVIIFDDFTTATQFVNFPFKAKSSAMKILVAKKNANITFIYEAMQLIKFEIGGHGRHWISQYSVITIPYPCIEEQQKIASFLSSLDTKIVSVNAQIERTQMYKKGLLQKMFV